MLHIDFRIFCSIIFMTNKGEFFFNKSEFYLMFYYRVLWWHMQATQELKLVDSFRFLKSIKIVCLGHFQNVIILK